MRRYVYFILAVWMATVLISCKPQTQGGETKESESETEFVFPAEIPVTPDDPEGTLYFTSKNWDVDLYMDESGDSQAFYILSKEPLNTEEINVSIPIETGYVVDVTDYSDDEYRITDYMLNKDQPIGTAIFDARVFPYYLYQCYRGTDWKLMKELYDEAEKADDFLIATIGGGESEERKEAKARVQRYHDYRDQYLKDYEALTSEDLPIFYIYEVKIYFGIEGWTEEIVETRENGITVSNITYIEAETVKSETFHTMDIQIGDKTYTQNIGEMRLHAEEITLQDTHPVEENWENIKMHGWPTITEYPWGDGRTAITGCEFEAEKDITVTGMFLYESDIPIIGAYVQKKKVDGDIISTVMDFYWDANSSMYIEKGEYVVIHLIIEDPKMTHLNYGMKLYPVLEYMVGDEEYQYRVRDTTLDREASGELAWIFYASVFDGIEEELESYFNDYYRPLNQELREPWREDFPW